MPPSWPPADTLPSPLPRPSLPPPKAVPPSLQVECYKLLTRLLQIPQVEPWIRNTAEYVLPPRPFHTRFIMPGSLSSQAVELLHATFCLGAPLCTLLDMLGSPSPPSLILDHDPRVFPYRDITIPEREEYIHSFIQRVGLLESTKKIKYGEVMRSSDLFSTTSIGWAKVLKTVHRVVDGLQETYPGVYAQPEDAVSRKEDLFLLFEQSERDQVQLIKQLKDKLVALGISHNPLLESVIANLERIEEWHERTLSSWKSSLSVEELLDWDAVLGPTTGDQLRSTALAAYRSLCVGLCGLADYLTSAKLAHSGHHNGPEILRHISHMLRQIPNYVHILEQLTMCLCPPLSAIDDVVPQPGSRLKKTSEPIFTNSLSSSPSMSFISVHSTAPTKPSLYGIAARASSLMTLRRTASAASTLSSSSSIRAGTITGEPIHASPQSTIGRSVSYETSRSPEDLAAKSWSALHTQMHTLYHLAVSMSEVGATSKGMWGVSVIGETLGMDSVTLERWGAFIVDDKMAISMRRPGQNEWEDVAVEVYAFEKAIVVCPAFYPPDESQQLAYPVFPWAPGPALMSPRREIGEGGSVLCIVPLDLEGPRKVYTNFFSDEEGERFVVFWPGHALEFMCLFGKPGAGHSQWEMWCSVFQGLRIDVNVQITLPSPAQVTGSELPDLLEEDEEDEYAKYIDPSPGPGSRDPSRASTPLDTDQAYDDASLRIPSPLGGQLLVYGSKPKPWSLIGRKGPRSESSSFIQAGEEDSETEESTGSFVVGDHEGSEDGGDQHTGERSTRPPRRSSRAESSTEPHDSGVGIESAVKRWSSVDEGVSTSLPASIGSDEIKIPDLGDLRDLTGQLDLEGRYPVASGGYGDVWKATLTMHSTDSVPPSVAVKVLRTRAGDPALQSKAQRRLNRELSIWRRLNHSNVLPLLGVAHDAFGGYGYAMVCPWLENGSISKWMEKCGDVLGMKERLTLICEVADGLSYLHSESIVHGDLSGSNILIDDAGHAVLCDFGLSILVAQLEFQTQDPSSVMGGGSVRWSDPLFFRLALQENNEDTPIPLFQANPATDIYSFGSVILEILSGRIPYHYIKTEAQVVIELHQGNKPRRPASTFVDDGQWNLIQSCWVDDHSIRPNIGVVSRLVRELCEAAQS